MLGHDTARLTLSRALPLHVGERALLRDPGAQEIVAGLVVLDPAPPPMRRHGAMPRARQLADMSGAADPAGEVARRGAVSRPQLAAMGVLASGSAGPEDAVVTGDWLIHLSRWGKWLAGLEAAVDRWAAAHPLEPGMPRNSAARSLGLPDGRILDALIAECSDLVSGAGGVHREGVSAALPEAAQQAIAEVCSRLAANPFAAPVAEEFGSLGLTARHLAAAVRSGLLVHVGNGVYLLPDAPEVAIQRVSALQQPFTLSDARQALGTTRRVAVPLLESLDRTGRTRRIDADRRVVETSAGNCASLN